MNSFKRLCCVLTRCVQRGLVRRTQIAGFDNEEFLEQRPTPLPPAKQANKLLDGFLLLESCQVEFPDEGTGGGVFLIESI